MFDNIYVLCSLGVLFAALVIAVIWMLQGHGPAAPGKPRRFCPLCNSALADNETLKGLIVDTKPPQKILIRGCSRCAPKTEQGEW